MGTEKLENNTKFKSDIPFFLEKWYRKPYIWFCLPAIICIIGVIIYKKNKRDAMKTQYKHYFDRLTFINRWNGNKSSRPSDWTIIGIKRWYCNWDEYKYSLCLFGFELNLWIKIKAL